MVKSIHVVAGILIEHGRVFMASRPVGKVCAGSWEFPGGKVEPNESIDIALVRELDEELGITVVAKDCIPFTKIYQSYAHADVELDVLLVKKWIGTPKALESQEIHWQEIQQPCRLEPLLITTQRILDLLLKYNGE